MLAEHGVDNVPTEAPSDEELQGVLAFALHLAERHKSVDFTDFDWDAPSLISKHTKTTMSLPYVPLRGRDAGDVSDAFERALSKPGGVPRLLALDARPSGLSEFEVGHILYGEVTLFSWPSKPPRSRDPRIEVAAESGWVETLKDHNVLPGRGIVVLDDDHGRYLTDPSLEDALGALVLFENGHIATMLNPFTRDSLNDPELQHWLSWGKGGPASEWQTVLDVSKENDGTVQ